jgi:hypothetical protein
VIEARQYVFDTEQQIRGHGYLARTGEVYHQAGTSRPQDLLDVLTIGEADADQGIGDGVLQAVDSNRSAIERIACYLEILPATHDETVGNRLLGRFGIEQAIRYLRYEAKQLRAHTRLFPQYVESVVGVLGDLQIRGTYLMSAQRARAAQQQERRRE